MTRNVTMTIRKPNGTLWASAAVTFDLLTKLTTRSTDSIFQYQVTVTTDVNGQATAALETPAEGDGAWLWRCTPPDGNWFDFALEYGGASAVDLSTIIAAISLGNIAPSAVAALLAAYALNSTVSSHTSSASNPHSVTAAQVGAASSSDLTTHTGLSTTAHGGILPQDAGILSKSSAYQLAAGDEGKIIECDGTFTVTLPDGLDEGFQVAIVNIGTGVITLAAATTLTTKDSAVTLANQYGGATVYRSPTTNVWRAIGDLS